MFFTRIKRVLGLGLTNTWRNRWLSFPAVLIIMMTLVMMGTFMALGYIANTTSQALKDKITVQVDFTDSAKDDQIRELQKMLSGQAGIMATYISKEDALKDFKTRTDIKQETRDLITAENNPLPRGLRIRALELDDLSKVESIVQRSQFKSIIYNFSYEDNKLLIERVNSITKFVKKAALIVTLVFVAVAIMVTLNTIQMAIYSRRDEIEIMRLVGAGQVYVKAPFYVEGALYGLVAATIAFILLFFACKYFSGVSSNYLRELSIDANAAFIANFWKILGAELIAGATLGMICSAISIRRYVRI